MNIAPSDFPRLAGAARLSKPGFDIILAVSRARQAAQPTVRLLQADATRRSHTATLNALRQMLGGSRRSPEQKAPHIVRFFNLSDGVNALPETMNSLFTRGFQPMLNSSIVDPLSSDTPRSDDEDME